MAVTARAVDISHAPSIRALDGDDKYVFEFRAPNPFMFEEILVDITVTHIDVFVTKGARGTMGVHATSIALQPCFETNAALKHRGGVAAGASLSGMKNVRIGSFCSSNTTLYLTRGSPSSWRHPAARLLPPIANVSKRGAEHGSTGIVCVPFPFGERLPSVCLQPCFRLHGVDLHMSQPHIAEVLSRRDKGFAISSRQLDTGVKSEPVPIWQAAMFTPGPLLEKGIIQVTRAMLLDPARESHPVESINVGITFLADDEITPYIRGLCSCM